MAAGVTYVPIATTTVNSNIDAVTFSSIPQTYTDLVLVAFAKDSNGYTDLKVNNDSSALYSRNFLYGDNSGVQVFRQTGLTSWYVGGNVTNPELTISHFFNYSNTTTYKTMISRGGIASGSTSIGTHLWRSTAAISEINIVTDSAPGTNTILTGSVYTLYGIAAA